VTAPMIVAGVGTLLSIVGMFMVRCKEGASQKNLLKALLTGTLGSSVLIVLALIGMWQMDLIAGGIVLSVISGLFAGVIIGQATEYYTSDEYKPTQGIAGQAVMGPATTIIDGLATGMYSAGIPVITIVVGIICAFGFAGGFSDMSMGLYGIGFAAVGMLATLGITLATDAYGPIADNAGGLAEARQAGTDRRKDGYFGDFPWNKRVSYSSGFAGCRANRREYARAIQRATCRRNRLEHQSS